MDQQQGKVKVKRRHSSISSEEKIVQLLRLRARRNIKIATGLFLCSILLHIASKAKAVFIDGHLPIISQHGLIYLIIFSALFIWSVIGAVGFAKIRYWAWKAAVGTLLATAVGFLFPEVALRHTLLLAPMVLDIVTCVLLFNRPLRYEFIYK